VGEGRTSFRFRLLEEHMKFASRIVSSRRRAALFAAASSTVIPFATQALAQTPTNWIGTTGSYLDSANWDNGVPTNAGNSIALINNGGTAQVGGTDSAEGAFLILGYQPGDTGHVEVSGGTLTVGEIRLGGTEVLADGTTPNGGGTGTILQTGGTVNVNYTTGTEPPVQSLYIGDSGLASGNTANGTYTISNGNLNVGINTADQIQVGTGAGAQGTLNQSGGTIA
jgi:hypothetical protein